MTRRCSGKRTGVKGLNIPCSYVAGISGVIATSYNRVYHTELPLTTRSLTEGTTTTRDGQVINKGGPRHDGPPPERRRAGRNEIQELREEISALKTEVEALKKGGR